MASLRKLLSNKTLSIEDLSYLNKLMKVNMPMNSVFDLLKTKSNKEMLDSISSKLNEGLLIEDIIKDYLPKNIEKYITPLLKNLPFSVALDISLSFYERQKENEKYIISNIGYPCVLLFVSLTALYLFDIFGVDTIFSIIKSFGTNLDLINSIRNVIRIFIYIFYYGILFITLLIFIYSRPKKIAFLYLLISKYFPNSLIHVYYSEQFVSLLLICVDRGYKTKTSLEMLMNMKNKPIISFMAYHLDEMLLEGKTLNEASRQTYFDINLSKFIKIGSFSNDFKAMLENYLELAKDKIKMKTKKYTLTIQMCTYISIGLIIIFVYQILFLPMQTLSSL